MDTVRKRLLTKEDWKRIEDAIPYWRDMVVRDILIEKGVDPDQIEVRSDIDIPEQEELFE